MLNDIPDHLKPAYLDVLARANTLIQQGQPEEAMRIIDVYLRNYGDYLVKDDCRADGLNALLALLEEIFPEDDE